MSALPHQIIINTDVLDQELEGESVLLNLANENYHGLDDIGTRIWQLLKNDGNIENLITTIIAEYDVEEAIFRQDLTILIEQLLNQNLIAVN